MRLQPALLGLRGDADAAVDRARSWEIATAMLRLITHDRPPSRRRLPSACACAEARCARLKAAGRYVTLIDDDRLAGCERPAPESRRRSRPASRQRAGWTSGAGLPDVRHGAEALHELAHEDVAGRSFRCSCHRPATGGMSGDGTDRNRPTRDRRTTLCSIRPAADISVTANAICATTSTLRIRARQDRRSPCEPSFQSAQRFVRVEREASSAVTVAARMRRRECRRAASRTGTTRWSTPRWPLPEVEEVREKCGSSRLSAQLPSVSPGNTAKNSQHERFAHRQRDQPRLGGAERAA